MEDFYKNDNNENTHLLKKATKLSYLRESLCFYNFNAE